MKKIVLISIIVGFVIVGIVSSLLISPTSLEPQTSIPVYEIDFTFSDVEKIQKSLNEHNLSMSTPSVITDHTIDRYCTFFDSTNTKRAVKYCTTTALLNSDGKTIGNLNMGGTTDNPIMALAIVDASPFLNSKADEVDIIFQTMIEILVCNCWEEHQPGGFESVVEWVDVTQEKYAESSKTTIKSEINGLDNKRLILEITSTGESYLWTLIVLKQS